MAKDRTPVSKGLGPDHYIMGRPMAIFDLYVVYRVIVVVSLATLLYHMLSKSKKQKTFPIWATIETALTVYIIGKGGLVQKI